MNEQRPQPDNDPDSAITIYPNAVIVDSTVIEETGQAVVRISLYAEATPQAGDVPMYVIMLPGTSADQIAQLIGQASARAELKAAEVRKRLARRLTNRPAGLILPKRFNPN